ncbi:MAG TPA: hypothetical protein VER78_01410 [Thermoanaerobaculia bacterium]|nr:hypothetical protein [Thermoanaerobaculia bacterium]
MTAASSRRALAASLAIVLLFAAAALWLPRWWENRFYRQVEAVVGAGARRLPGSVTDARRKIDPGKTGRQVRDAIGLASFAVHTEGSSAHDIWTYYYADGSMTINLTDGIVKRISLSYGTPKIPTSSRP